jgi:hypothetical protein
MERSREVSEKLNLAENETEPHHIMISRSSSFLISYVEFVLMVAAESLIGALNEVY